MRKILCFVLAMMLCMSLALPSFAANFTPSAENKGAPEIVEIQDAEKKPAAGIIVGGDLAEGDEYVYEGDCLVVTAVKDAKTSTLIPDAAEKALLDVYEGIKSGSIKVPYEELDSANADKLVIRDLFDVSLVCAGKLIDHNAELEPVGVTLEVKFDLNIKPGAKVYVMVYKNNQWQKIEKVTNNGDGSVTCVFEHLCPVAIIVEGENAKGGNMTTTTTTATGSSGKNYFWNPKTGDFIGQNMLLWVGIMAVSAVALTAVVVINRKKQK